MKEWLTILRDHYYDTETEDVPPDMFTIRGLQYSMYGGVGLLASFSKLTGSLFRLERSLEELEKKLPIVSKHSELPPMNCATYILAAFPEANVTCPLGVPIMCSVDPEKQFEDLSGGVQKMADDSETFVTRVDIRKAYKMLSDATLA